MTKPPYGAIAGLGLTPMTRSWQGDATVLAARAIKLALEDAGLEKPALDGLLIASGLSGRDPSTGSPLGLGLQTMMGLRNLKLMNHMSAAGSTPGQAIQYASMAIQAGICTTVACVWADSPLNTGQSAGGAYGGGNRAPTPGMAGLGGHYGFFGANTSYALAA